MERIHNFLKKIYDKAFTELYRSSFKKMGRKSILCMPFSVNGAKYISIESEVYIKPNSWLLALDDDASTNEKLSIGSKTYIGRNVHIVAIKGVHISSDVLISDNVYLADNYHHFENGNKPYKDQGVGFKKEVLIGQGSWLGENVCVLSSHIGKQCIIGANSVVTKDIPDYSMAVGTPAKVIKKFDYTTNCWIEV
ncbi:MAG: acyltransferase [Flavobacteriales bacterium]|nr:acyltransferase [Flavobacteriales bacterium]MBL6873687.1 acyltransferase [Flavobacteriales bacterium]